MHTAESIQIVRGKGKGRWKGARLWTLPYDGSSRDRAARGGGRGLAPRSLRGGAAAAYAAMCISFASRAANFASSALFFAASAASFSSTVSSTVSLSSLSSSSAATVASAGAS